MKHRLVALLIAACAAPAFADVSVKDAWVRPSIATQKVTAAYLELKADSDARLVGVSSPVAGIAQIHEMRMEGDVMRMRELKDGLALPANATITLKPGGNHLMLMDLKQAVKAGETVKLLLDIEDKGGKRTLEVQAAVRAPIGAGHEHHH